MNLTVSSQIENMRRRCLAVPLEGPSAFQSLVGTAIKTILFTRHNKLQTLGCTVSVELMFIVIGSSLVLFG